MKKDGIENVRAEEVMVPKWVRGEESAKMLKPWQKNLAMLGLGGSIGTKNNGITAKVISVNSFEELATRSDEVKGKIVLFNVPFDTYSITVKYIVHGAIEASKHGAVASLVRSVGTFSMNTPHTGNSSYEDGIKKIPHAAITIEDAAMMTMWLLEEIIFPPWKGWVHFFYPLEGLGSKRYWQCEGVCGLSLIHI